VYFNGYDLVYNEETKRMINDKVINMETINYLNNTPERIAKYILQKKFTLTNTEQYTDKIDPLYLFKESDDNDQTYRNLFLLTNATLHKIYNMIFIRKNPRLDMITNSHGKYYGNKKQRHNNNTGLTSEITFNKNDDKVERNKFGLPQVLYNIKMGVYSFEECYESYDTDVCGFNTACYIIMYEKNEDKIIEYFNNSDKFNSKNLNKYDLSYVQLAALLNRLKIVKMFINKKNFADVMKIAVYEDNVELYKMTYKLISSDERYRFTRAQLIAQKAYDICKELYGELMEDEIAVQSVKTQGFDVTVIDKIDENDMQSFVKLHALNPNSWSTIRQYLINRCEKKNIIETDKYKLDGYSANEMNFYNYQLSKINNNTSYKFNKFFAAMTSTETDYKTSLSVTFASPLNSILLRHTFLQLIDGYLNPDYAFNSKEINNMLLYLDNVELIKNHKNQKELECFLTSNKNQMKENYTKFVKDNYDKVSSIELYNTLLLNTNEHSLAYSKLELSDNYSRTENAIGYTPDDIIIFATIRDYCESALPNKVRSESVKNINRSLHIIPFVQKVDTKLAQELLPEMFKFAQFASKNEYVILSEDSTQTCVPSRSAVSNRKIESSDEDED
jgi:hypothetical protein